MDKDKTTPTTRGGTRPGSGRKAAKEKKVTISFRVTEETRNRIQKLRETGFNVNRSLEDAVFQWEFRSKI